MVRIARWFLVMVLVVDVIVVAALLTGGTSVSRAQSDGEPLTPAEETRWTREALQLLGREMAARAAELDERQLELEEMLRSTAVLARAGIEQPAAIQTAAAQPQTPAAADAAPTAAVQAGSPATARPTLDAAARQELFERLRKTYENMEPESAATALSQLAILDKGAVVELILGWKPRSAAAVLDALTVSDPALAADLSYGIWLRSGKNRPDPAP